MMTRQPTVSLGISQRDWASRFTEFVVDHGGVSLLGTVLTQRDVLEDASAVVLIDDIASFLTPRLVERVHRQGRRVVGLYDPLEGEVGRKRLTEMGVDEVVSARSSPEAILEIVIDIGRDVDPMGDTQSHTAKRFGGRITVVTGFGGATEIACHLASHSAQKSLRTVLVDLDTISPSIAQRLALPVSPNLLSGLDSLVRSSGHLGDSLLPHSSGMRVLPGLARGRDWELAPSDQVADLLTTLSEDEAHVIVDVNFLIEPSSGPGLRGRFSAARAALGEADSVVVCTAPNPIGIRRLLRWSADAEDLIAATPIHVVVMRAPRSRYQRGEITTELVRGLRPVSIHWIPTDAGLARAAWDGRLLRRGPLARGVRRLASRLDADPLRLRSAA